MGKIKDLTGQRYGRLTALSFDGISNGHSYWLCECECGTKKSIRSDALQKGDAQSCGCLCSEASRARMTAQITKHSCSRERLYHVWHTMKHRCYNKNDVKYAIYGGRGITVCDSWKNDYQEFKKWALANGYDADAKRGECTIDRIDVNGNYEPQNCRFVSMKIQNKNRRI